MGIWAEIKYALNSTLGTPNFMPLNEYLKGIIGGRVEFTSDGVFTVPNSVKHIYVTACGGGGGGNNKGSSSSSDNGGGGGGGADCISSKKYFVEGIAEIPITIGVGGAAADASKSWSKGSDGTPTIVGSLVTLAGGHAGKSSEKGGLSGGYGGGAGGAGGYRNSGTGGTGGKGLVGIGGSGEGPSLGGGGGGGSLGNGGAADTGTLPGYGGGGFGYNAGGSANGPSAGGDGIVIIEWGLAAL